MELSDIKIVYKDGGRILCFKHAIEASNKGREIDTVPVNAHDYYEYGDSCAECRRIKEEFDGESI